MDQAVAMWYKELKGGATVGDKKCMIKQVPGMSSVLQKKLNILFPSTQNIDHFRLSIPIASF